MKYISNKKKFISTLISGLTLLPAFANAAVTGQIDVSLNVVAGCEVSSINAPSNNLEHLADGSDWMQLNFKPADMGEDTTHSQMNIQCTEGAPSKLTLNAGKYGSKTKFYMEDASGSKLAYTLASDKAGTDLILPYKSVTTPDNGEYTIYASTNIASDTQVGTYSDSIQATLTW